MLEYSWGRGGDVHVDPQNLKGRERKDGVAGVVAESEAKDEEDYFANVAGE